MRGDGKDKFYRTLKLDGVSRQTLKDFTKIKKEMIKDMDKKRGEKNDGKNM